MKILTNWLRTYVPNIPTADHELADDLTLRGIAVEGVHHLGNKDDGTSNGHLFEMDITTNRVDAMNHYGIAREAATIYNLPLASLTQIVELSSRPEAAPLPPERRDPRISFAPPRAFPVRIEAPHLCGRFTAQILRNVTIAPSTGQVAEYFTLLGQKLISNAVDASNFVLLGMGHPTHAFDLDRIRGGIVVRLARKGERLKLLDGTDRTLESDDLVVADEAKPLALAGVMGGWDSMITPETVNILVEAAWFDPASIRRSARRHGLHTDASHRFERGADFNAAPTANRLVSELIRKHGGYAEGVLIDVVMPKIEAKTAARHPIALRVEQVQRHLGATLEDTATQSALTPELIDQYLTALGCTLTESNPAPPPIAIKKTGMVNPLAGYSQTSREAEPRALDPSREKSLSTFAVPERAGGFSPLKSPPSATGFSPGPSATTFRVQLPSWRLDLEREIDLIEEVARVFGYNRFANTLPTPGIVIAHPLAAKEAAVRTRLLALGFSESISSTFASQQDINLFSHSATNPGAPYLDSEMWASSEARPLSSTTPHPVPLENPLSEEASLLRPSLIPGMAAMLAHNLNRDVKEVRLFEQGQVFTGTTLPGSSSIEAVHESPQLSLGLTTANRHSLPPHNAQDAPFFELKGVIESIVSLFTPAGGPAALSFISNAPAWLQPGRSATALLNNQPIAYLGELAYSQRESRKLRQPVYLAQLDLARLYELPLKRVTARDLSRFQAVERDFSFVFPETILWHTVAAAIHALAIPELQSLKPIEVFHDPKKYPGVYSLLLRAVFQSPDRTLRDDELTAWWSSIISTLTSLGGAIRAPGAASL